MAKPASPGNIIRLVPMGNETRMEVMPPVDAVLDVGHLVSARTAKAVADLAAPVAPDLTGKTKALLVVGAGNVGKTTFLRWAIERATGDVALATFDPVNRALKYYFENCTSPDGPATSNHLQWFLSKLATEPVSGAIDFGAGDVSLTGLAGEIEGLGAVMEAQGLASVLVAPVGARVEDLTPLAGLQACGFRASATLLIRNWGVVGTDSTGFDAISVHPVWRKAVEEGAAVVDMPRCFAMQAVGRRRFSDAVIGNHLGLFDLHRLKHWLAAMDIAFAPVKSWLP